MKSCFDPRPLNAILPQSLINRGTSLLLDFIGVANGCRNLEEFIPTDINALIAEVAQAWQASPHLDASVIDQADDYEKYLAALVLRIGHEPVAGRPILCFTPLDHQSFVSIAAARFFDTLLNFLEWIKQAGPSLITLATDMDHNGPLITVLPGGWDGSSSTPYEEKKMNSFRRRFRICGLVLQPGKDGFRLTPVPDCSEADTDC